MQIISPQIGGNALVCGLISWCCRKLQGCKTLKMREIFLECSSCSESLSNKRPSSKEKAPVIMGHEFSGEAVEGGKDVTTVRAGDRVEVEPSLSWVPARLAPMENTTCAPALVSAVWRVVVVDLRNTPRSLPSLSTKFRIP